MSGRTRDALLLTIICVGFLLRASGLFWGEGYHYSGMRDELLSYRAALELDAGDERALYIGQPNFKSGKLPGPLWTLFWLAGLKVGGSPQAVCLMMIGLGTAVIYLVYRLAENVLGPEYSLWAALFYATSPWAVHYSVGGWNPQPMAFFGALLYLALWDVVTRPNSPRIFWVCVLLAIMPQFHMIVMFVAPAAAVMLWLGRARLNWRWCSAGLAVSVLLYIPYVIGESSHAWENTRKIFSGAIDRSFGVFKIFTLPFIGLSNFVSSTTGRDFSEYRAFGDACFGSSWVLLAFSALSLGLSFIIVASFIAALCVEVCGLWRQPRLAFAAAPGLVFVGVLLVLPLLLFTVSLSNFNSRYLIVQYPLLFLLPAVFMVRGLNFSRWRHPARALTVLTVAFNIVLSLAYYHYQGQRIARADHFLPSFRKMESVRRLLKADAGPNCRIRIEDRFVENKNSKTSAGDVIDLVEYVRVCEQVDPLPARSQCLKTYRVRDPADAPYAGERIIYAGNGIVITSVK